MEELTFETLTDIGVAHERGRINVADELAAVVPGRLGPFIEMCFRLETWGLSLETLPSLRSTELGHAFLRTLRRNQLFSEWRPGHSIGLLKLDKTSGEGADEEFVRFGLRAKRAAIGAGIPDIAAGSLVGAIAELRDNVVEHSERAASGMIGYFASSKTFEFVVADGGVGVLQSLRRNPAYTRLANSGEALRTALKDGETRFGHGSGRGHGFRQLFRGLQKIHGVLHFKSGDHRLEHRGLSPSIRHLDLAQVCAFRGLLISAVCHSRHGTLNDL